jgi:hypothetical protein
VSDLDPGRTLPKVSGPRSAASPLVAALAQAVIEARAKQAGLLPDSDGNVPPAVEPGETGRPHLTVFDGGRSRPRR